VKAFNVCLASDRHLDEIDQNAKDANAARLTGRLSEPDPIDYSVSGRLLDASKNCFPIQCCGGFSARS
jgi:hypothetical protein